MTSMENVYFELTKEFNRDGTMSRAYLEQLWRSGLPELPVEEAHVQVVELAERWLPRGPDCAQQGGGRADADAQ